MNAGGLNSAEAVHYAAVLIAHLRAIKNGTTPGAITHQLDQSVGTADAAEAQQNWLAGATNQNSIDTNLNAVTAAQLKVLEEYHDAHTVNPAAGKGLA